VWLSDRHPPIFWTRKQTKTGCLGDSLIHNTFLSRVLPSDTDRGPMATTKRGKVHNFRSSSLNPTYISLPLKCTYLFWQSSLSSLATTHATRPTSLGCPCLSKRFPRYNLNAEIHREFPRIKIISLACHHHASLSLFVVFTALFNGGCSIQVTH
jgi:hypothetical protein